MNDKEKNKLKRLINEYKKCIIENEWVGTKELELQEMFKDYLNDSKKRLYTFINSL